MKSTYRFGMWLIPAMVVAGSGCTARNIDFSTMARPARASELDAYDVFVGVWDWEAETLNARSGAGKWSGTAAWQWTLDKQCLRGTMSAKSGETEYEAEGVWSWHPAKKRYIWWMFNDWGYPQEGTAKYDPAKKLWCMNYKSIGLDGTDSYGRYCIQVIDNNTLDWRMVEWADPMHMIKKIEMNGTYKRRR